MAQGGAVGSRRIPARKGFSALAIAGSSSLTLIAMGKGYHEAAPDYQRAITHWQAPQWIVLSLNPNAGAFLCALTHRRNHPDEFIKPEW